MREENAAKKVSEERKAEQALSKHDRCMKRIREDPTDLESMLELYKYLMEQGLYSQAIAPMARVIMRVLPGSGTTADYWLKIAKAYMLCGKYERALFMASEGYNRCACTPKKYRDLAMICTDAHDMLGHHDIADRLYDNIKSYATEKHLPVRERLTSAERQTKILPNFYIETA